MHKFHYLNLVLHFDKSSMSNFNFPFSVVTFISKICQPFLTFHCVVLPPQIPPSSFAVSIWDGVSKPFL